MYKLSRIDRSRVRFEALRRKINTILVVLFVLLLTSLTAQYGFHVEAVWVHRLEAFDVFVLLFFIGQQAVKLLFAPDRRIFFRERRLEFALTGTVLLLIPLLALALPWMEAHFPNFASVKLATVYLALAQFVIILDMALSGIRGGRRIMNMKIQPARFFIGGFVVAIISGTLALSLPKATTSGITVVDALFTATSAVCVTGLIVVDTPVAFTMFGHSIILLLVQIGGLGLMTFTTFLILFSDRLSIRERVLMREFLGRDNLGELRSTLRRIVGMTLIIESIGAVYLYVCWPSASFDATGARIFSAVFHSVSAFCNAGFSLFSNSMMDAGVAFNPLLNIGMASLIVLGGLGFLTIANITSLRPWRARIIRPGIRLTLHTRLVLVTTGILLAGGTLLFFLLEYDNTLHELSLSEQIMASFFQSVTARTAGFNTTDIGKLAVPTSLLLMLLMFVGASPGSTGGGIKTTTAALLFLSAIRQLRGARAIEVAHRKIPESSVNKAHTVLLLGLSLLFLSVMLLSLLESLPLLDIIFECVSAIATTGLSRGITYDLSTPSKIVLIFSMLIGRVGVLTFMHAVLRPARTDRHDYPSESVIVS